ncbi:Dystroglycan (Dystrophin-associated glycoprotein 1) [Nesidiocoris tenuis]|uniref:Dystroglycan 1 n=1 Tax=Nesidiocoris tenuis TaxID=355587 RepID=A0ABN7AE60_9HEMI|nr:Dystroglycan (Dystrophin-associated glycoprotein 1) [Nesidiocoris tenuis]
MSKHSSAVISLVAIVVLQLMVKATLGEDDMRLEHLKNQPLQRLWGIPDTTAKVGYFFHYQIPRSAFDGSVSKFKAYSENGEDLPEWLVFHERTGILEGVPSEENLGEHYITIEAFDEDHRGSVKDVFALEVLARTSARFSHLKTDCKPTEEKSVISLVLDVHFPTTTAKQKVFILKNLAEFLNVKKELIYMTHIVEKNDLLQPNVVDAGPGNIIQRTSSGPLTVLSLQIGCSGHIWEKFNDRISLIKTNSKNGELASILNAPIIGWKLTREDNDFRKRRETPVANLIDVNEEISGVPEQRVVVENTETPTFHIDPSPTYQLNNVAETHKRRHHRGEPDSDTSAVVLPTLSIMPTPTYIPDRPTILNSLNFDPLDTLDIMTEIMPTAVYGEASPSIPALAENRTDDVEMIDERWSSAVSSPSSSYTSADLVSSPSGEPTPTLPTNQTTTAEDVSYGARNFPPNIGQRVKKMAITAGKVLKYQIPNNAFNDLEDGNTSDLQIQLLTSEGTALADNSWIQYDEATQSIYALPLEEHVSRWIFTLRAIDSGGLSTEDHIEVTVQNHRGRRTVNHAFTAELASAPSGFSLDWQLKLLSGIIATFGDPDSTQITVLDISVDPPVFSWTNDSIPRSGCPTSDIENMQKILSGEDGLKKNVPEGIHIKKVSWSGVGHCEAKTTKPAEVPPKAENLPPFPRNQVDYFNATVGQLLVFQVPEDTFYDPEDGSTRNLRLSLLTMERGRIPPNHWLQFDPKNQEFYGIPFTAGQTEYQLVCQDSGNEESSDGLVVIVHQAPRVMYNVEFSITLAVELNDFLENPKMQRMFVEKLALVFGDPNTNSIVISGFAPGSTVVTWHNKSLPTNFCPDSEILALRQILLGDDEKVTNIVTKLMAPEFPVVSSKLTPTGLCQGALTEISISSGAGAGSGAGGSDTVNSDVTAVSHGEHYIIGLVIPALVIAVMLLCAGLVACVLYRRKRTGKMSVGDEDERQTFKSKGIPVIFQDELDERPEPTNKSPVIMKEEKPPLPPPEYHHRSGGGGPPLATTALLSDTEDSSSPYQPPPPFTTSRDSARPKPTPTYRMPPPYVPP